LPLLWLVVDLLTIILELKFGKCQMYAIFLFCFWKNFINVDFIVHLMAREKC